MARHPRRPVPLWDALDVPRTAWVIPGVAGPEAILSAEAVRAARPAAQPPKPDAGPERDAAMSDTEKVAALVTAILKLEAEVETLKQTMIQMSARMLRLELAISVLDKDGSLTEILRPEQFQPEQF